MNIFDAYDTDLTLRNASPKSVLAYRRVVRLWREYLKEHELTAEAARRSDVQDWLLRTGWAPTTMRQIGLAWLSAAYAYGEDLELCDANPCRRVRLPRAPRQVVRTVSPATLREIRAGVRDGEDELLLALYAWTGMRGIEVRRLTWLDVSLADNTMKVIGKALHERLVPIHPVLRGLLLNAERGSDAYVVAGRGGGMVTVGGLHYRTARIWGEHGVRGHDLRRTVATSLRRNGVDRETLKSVMGWASDGSMMESHYNFVDEAERQAAILRLYADEPWWT